MILVDSSVWIDYFNGVLSPETDTLDSILTTDFVVVGDLILVEVLQGFRDDRDFAVARELLTDLGWVTISDKEIALRAAANHRKLRKKGFTVRKTIDNLIATFCIEKRIPLLHADRDFDPFETHLGLQIIK